MTTKVKVKLTNEAAKIPFYANPGDAGMDLSSVESYILAPGEHKLIKTGVSLEMPEGIEAQVRPRSGLAYKFGVTVLNSPGTIDSGFRAELGVILINHGKSNFQVNIGDRIAQLVFNKVEKVELIEAELSESVRGKGGFGSTGVS